jgi:hypothetical protein
MRFAAVALLALLAGGLISCSSDEDESPTATPVPTASPDRSPAPDSVPTNLTPHASSPDGLIPLDQPIPYPLPFTIGPRNVMLPTGSIVTEEQSDPGGLVITISRGQSRAVFNGDTGDVIEWSVLDEDLADFEPLRAN